MWTQSVDNLFNRNHANSKRHFGLPSGRLDDVAEESSIHVHAMPEHWRVDIPLPGIDPARISLTATAHLLTLAIANPDGSPQTRRRLCIPTHLDTTRMTARSRYGVLELTIPLHLSHKARHVEIDGFESAPRQIAAA